VPRGKQKKQQKKINKKINKNFLINAFLKTIASKLIQGNLIQTELMLGFYTKKTKKNFRH